MKVEEESTWDEEVCMEILSKVYAKNVGRKCIKLSPLARVAIFFFPKITLQLETY